MYGNTLVNQQTVVTKNFLTQGEQVYKTTWELNIHFSILQTSRQSGTQLCTVLFGELSAVKLISRTSLNE